MRQMAGGRTGGRPEYPPGGVQLYGAHGQPLSIQPPPPPPGDYQIPGHPYPGRGSSPGPHQGPAYESSYEQSSFSELRDRPASDAHPMLPPFPRRSSQGDYPSWSRQEQPTSPPILPPPRGYSPPTSHSSKPSYGYGESAPSTYYPPAPPGPAGRPSPPFQVERPASISPHPSTHPPHASIHPPMWPGPQRPESTGPPTAPSAVQAPSLRMGLSNLLDAQGSQRSAHDHEMLNQLKRAL